MTASRAAHDRRRSPGRRGMMGGKPPAEAEPQSLRLWGRLENRRGKSKDRRATGGGAAPVQSGLPHVSASVGEIGRVEHFYIGMSPVLAGVHACAEGFKVLTSKLDVPLRHRPCSIPRSRGGCRPRTARSENRRETGCERRESSVGVTPRPTCGRGAGTAHLRTPAPTDTSAAPDEHACEKALQYGEAAVRGTSSSAGSRKR
jgi:hypothetical protein